MIGESRLPSRSLTLWTVSLAVPKCWVVVSLFPCEFWVGSLISLAPCFTGCPPIRDYAILNVTSSSFRVSWSFNSTRRRPFHVRVYKGEELVWSARTAGRTLQVAGLEAGELYTVKTGYQACGANVTATLAVRTGKCRCTHSTRYLCALVPPSSSWPRDSHPPSPGSQGRTGQGRASPSWWGCGGCLCSHVLGAGLWRLSVLPAAPLVSLHLVLSPGLPLTPEQRQDRGEPIFWLEGLRKQSESTEKNCNKAKVAAIFMARHRVPRTESPNQSECHVKSSRTCFLLHVMHPTS